MEMTDEECIAAWTAATCVGAGGPDGAADRAAIAIVRLMIHRGSDPESTALWLSALYGSCSNGDVKYPLLVKTIKDVRMAALGIVEIRRAGRAEMTDERDTKGLCVHCNERISFGSENTDGRFHLGCELDGLRAELERVWADAAAMRSTLQTIHDGMGESNWIFTACERALAANPGAALIDKLAALESENSALLKRMEEIKAADLQFRREVVALRQVRDDQTVEWHRLHDENAALVARVEALVHEKAESVAAEAEVIDERKCGKCGDQFLAGDGGFCELEGGVYHIECYGHVLEARVEAVTAELVTWQRRLDNAQARLESLKQERDEASTRWKSLLCELWDGVRLHELWAPSQGRDGERLIHAYCGAVAKLKEQLAAAERRASEAGRDNERLKTVELNFVKFLVRLKDKVIDRDCDGKQRRPDYDRCSLCLAEWASDCLVEHHGQECILSALWTELPSRPDDGGKG